ncbi:TlpA family protein disulfide reductase [Sphingobacterium hotanense]|uniref:TlpA family protein disulfide reductase n=1 Tax=Sphingobacterium hotanense TaxID=649196 RepID=UPI0021A95B57|nr:TlpA disulfide reductase family protein [Sphingobacterium hotanense]MCT1526861.1 TlpA family protein disulfide reductase [Sphingobacterium hotanense]
MKTKAIILLFLIHLTHLSLLAQEQPFVLFEGKTDSKYDDTKVILYNNNTKQQDTAIVRDGKWMMKLPYHSPTRHMFASEAESAKHGGYSPFGILVEKPGVIQIEGDLESFYTSKVNGSEAQDAANQFLIGTSNSMEEKAELIQQIIERYPNSIGSAFILSRYSAQFKPEDAWTAYELLSEDVKRTDFGKAAKTQIEGMFLSAVGSIVNEFTLKNEKDEDINLSDFKGNYVLLDFWASWCVPCIQEFKTLKTVHSEYTTTYPFKIIGISIDQNPAAWHTALKQHQLPWTQLLDQQKEKSIASGLFAITSIPATFLLDQEGKIIAKNLRGAELEEFLSAIFKEKEAE